MLGLTKWKRQEKNENPVFLPTQNIAMIDLHNHPEINRQLELIGLTGHDLTSIRVLKPFVEDHADEIANTFYEKVHAVPRLRKIIESHSTIERLKQTLTEYLMEMFNGKIDEEYIQKRMMVARMHIKVGVEPKWYLGAFQQVQEVIQSIITKNPWPKTDIEKALLLVSKLISFETQLVLEEYEKENLRVKEQQYEKIKNELKNQISTLTEDLAQLSEETSISVKQVIQHTSKIDQNIQSNVARVERIQVDATEGNRLVQELESKIANIASNTKNMTNLVEKLTHSSDTIREIISMVKEIADQTNLLALNAAIEAARAGAAGNGFAVVAQEVRKLAEQSKRSVEEITELIQASISLTDQAVATTSDIKGDVSQSLEGSEKTQNKFQLILGLITENNKEINQVKEDMEVLVEVIEEIGIDTSKVADTASDLNFKTKDL